MTVEQKVDLANVVMDPNPDAPTTGLDRGDDFQPNDAPEPSKTPAVKKVDAPLPKAKEAPEPKAKDAPKDDDKPADDETPERDENGRFVKKAKVEDPEAVVDPDGDPDADPDTKPEKKEKPTVPLARFSEVIRQRNELAAALAAKDAEEKSARKEDKAQVKEINTELDKLYEQVEELRAEGKSKDAAAIQRQIDAKNREIGKIEGQATARAEAILQAENREYDNMLGTLAESDDRYDADSPDFDQRVVNRTEFYVRAFQKEGMSPTAALREAVMAMTGKDLFSKKRTPKEEKKPEAKVADKKPEPKTTNVTRNVDKAKRQPPTDDDRIAPDDDGKIDVANMSDDDFDKLPEAKKRELRGDVFEG